MQWFKALNRAVSSDRPLGINLIVAFLSFIGGFYLFMLLASLIFLNLLSSMTPMIFSFQVPSPELLNMAKTRPMKVIVLQAPDFTASVHIILSFSILAFLYLALARGLHLNKWWGYWGTVLLELVNIVVAFSTSRNGLQIFTSLYLPLLILAYLLFMLVQQRVLSRMKT